MAKFIKVPNTSASYYFDERLSIGLYELAENRVVLLDSGLDESTAKKVNNALKDNKQTVIAIINTHHHADHCGGNAFFQKQYPNIKIYATEREKIFIQYPDMQPLCFCSGAYPFKELRVKYLQPAESIVTDEIKPYQDQSLEIEDSFFQIVTLPGHTAGMIGIITPDNVLYCGDAFFGGDTFKKHGVLYYSNIETALASFEKLKTLNMRGCVFYHGAYIMADEVSLAADAHKTRLLETAETILTIVKNQNNIDLDTLTQKVMHLYEVPNEVMAFTLTKTSVIAYVSYLQTHGKINLAMIAKKLTISLN